MKKLKNTVAASIAIILLAFACSYIIVTLHKHNGAIVLHASVSPAGTGTGAGAGAGAGTGTGADSGSDSENTAALQLLRSYSIMPDETYKITITDPASVIQFYSGYSDKINSNGNTGTVVQITVQDSSGTVIWSNTSLDAMPPLFKNDGKYFCNITIRILQPEDKGMTGIMEKAALFARNLAYYPGLFFSDSHTLTYLLEIETDLPARFEFSALAVEQGDMIKITIYNANEGEVPFLDQSISSEFKFFKGLSIYTGYIPTNYSIKPGRYPVEYGTTTGSAGYSSYHTSHIDIAVRDFKIQHLEVDPNVTATTQTAEAYAEYAVYFDPVRLVSNEKSYCDSAFLSPVAGRLSTEFGETRHVKGIPTSYRHSGLDIAAPEGTPVLAANCGKVVLSMYLKLTGNTVVIDHGQGLFSVYFHMKTRKIEKGVIAEKGQQIGEVGTTGFSTGPHLHFTMSYYYINLEPGYFIAGEAITADNYKEYLK